MATAKKAPAKKAPAKRTVPVKKTIAKKASAPKKTEAPAWNTVHVFGYGESQVIGSKANGKVANSELKALAPLFAALAKKQQKGTKLSLDDTHALNIFNGSFVDYRPRGVKNNGQRFAWAEVDTKAINRLADELISKAPEVEPRRRFIDIFVTGKALVIRDKKAVKTKRVIPTGSGKKATNKSK